MKAYFTRPSGLRENAETAISCRGPGPARKRKEVCQWSLGGRKCNRCALVAKANESRIHVVGECEMYKGERDVWRRWGKWTNVTWTSLAR